jgi:hypothetical protein
MKEMAEGRRIIGSCRLETVEHEPAGKQNGVLRGMGGGGDFYSKYSKEIDRFFAKVNMDFKNQKQRNLR